MANNKDNQVEDIFAGTERAGKKATAPVKPAVRPRQSVVQSAAPPPQPAAAMPPRKNRKTLLILLAIVVVGLAGLAVLIQSGVFSPKPPGTNAAQNTNGRVTNSSQPPVQLPVINMSTRDADSDGLTDDEEKQLGTNGNSRDTDGDQLFDREEVKAYKTNPLKRDTDGDGTADGAEVASGDNPNGSGKLLNLQAELEKTRN